MTKKARLGDKIIVTNPDFQSTFGHEFIVVESPWCPSVLNDISEYIWVTDSILTFWLRHDSYEIIKQPKVEPLVSCQDCGGTGKIVLFTSTVTCRCCIKEKDK